MVTNRTKRSSDAALKRDSLSHSFEGIEGLLMSFEDLTAMGRIDYGSRPVPKFYRDNPTQSRFGHALKGYEDSLAAADPAFAAYQKTIQSGLEGIESGIPDDLRRSITENIRSSQAQRGIIDSNVAGIEEVVRLMGGQEAVRGQRLAQADQYFNSAVMPGISGLLPQIGNVYGGELQRSIETGRGRREAVQIGTNLASSTLDIL
jgi:hypothetical protein